VNNRSDVRTIKIIIMSQLILILILLVQTRATLEIFALLLLAAAIGYAIAWFYIKSYYLKKVRTIESEINQLKVFLEFHNSDQVSLSKNLIDKNKELVTLIRKVNGLKEINAESVQQTEELILKNEKSEQLIIEKDKALELIAQRRHLLDFNSFGTATESERDDLSMISGIGPFIEQRLHALDILAFRQISNFTDRDIEKINEAIEYFSGRIERDEWVVQARELVNGKDKKMALLNRIRDRKTRIYYNRIGIATREEADDLTTISGIGGWIKEKLNALDIFTFRQIGNFTAEDVDIVTEVIEYFPGRIDRDEWILQARELVRIAGNKAELLARIRERKGRIYYDRLGIAHTHQANNLTLIHGISLWIEERLNLLEIFTFNQISNLTSEDVDTITDVLEIYPGRIDEDNWVLQAHVLAQKPSHQIMICI
jgi:predicted flap endonuclease-1-like 5' DNA nuclease